MLTPRFVPAGAMAPIDALAIDGAVPGARAVYSHWQGDHTTPAELQADTSTGMLVRAATDPDRWLAPFAGVVNNHVDADGLLSLLAACRPGLAVRHAPLLIAAATTGDFTVWTGERPFDLVLRLHQLIRGLQAGGPGWEQRCLEAAVAAGDDLLGGSWPGEDERRAAIAQAVAAIAQPPAIRIDADLAVVTWERRRGHRSDGFLTVYEPDDLPLLALSTRIPPHCFQLLCEGTAEGAVIVLDAPRHSWARTVDLPTVPWPDLASLAAELRAAEPALAWCARPAAAETGFTCLLASCGPSRMDLAGIVAACRRHLHPSARSPSSAF